jgi:putative ABC transport system permease protein
VADAVYAHAIESQPRPVYYLPLAQNYESGVTLHLRTSLAPLSLVPALRQAVREIDPQLVLTRPRTLDEQFTRSLSEQRMMATLIALFGGVALALATVGLYGTMAHLAGQRTTEVGIRLALGASRSSIMRMMVGEGARLVALGALVGVGGALAGTRLLRTQLFGIAPTDPGTFAAVVALLWIAGVLACAIPARRAMRIDPAVALRNG